MSETFHQDILNNLKKLLDDDQLAHAMIISGRDGSGKLELGLELAKMIVTEKVPNPSDDRVSSAKNKVDKLIHPDIHFSFPFIGNVTSNDFLKEWREAVLENPFMNITEWMMRLDAENKQANINAKECHSIIQKLGLKSFESEYKVLLMWLPEYLGKEGNRLLKLIEEPPENTVFILITENTDRILNTILSRCQLIKVPSPSDTEIERRLVEKEGLTQEVARKISFLAEGNYRIACDMRDNQVMDYSEQLFEWLRTCYKLKPEEIVNWCDNFGKLTKEQQKYFVTYGLQFFRSFLMLDVVDEDQLRFLEKEIKVAQNLKRFIDLEALEKIEELLNDSFMLIERNASVKMLFMKNSIRIHELFHVARIA